MKSILSFLFGIFLLCASAYSQSPIGDDLTIPIHPVKKAMEQTPPPTLSEIDFNRSRSEVDPILADTLEKLVKNYWESLQNTGLSAALITPEGDVWTGQGGISSMTDTLNEMHTFGMGSISKTFTAAAIMRLVEDGLLTLEDPIDDFLPSLNNVDSTITIRQLLQHTSGVFNYTNNPLFGTSVNANPEQIFAPEDIFQWVNAPYFSPGNGWTYSNTGYILCGMIIEAVTGQSYHIYLREQFIDPLGLSSIALFPQESWTLPKAHMWLDLTGDGLPDDSDAMGIEWKGLFSGAWAAGAFTSTPTDVAQWIKALYSGQVLAPSSLEEMQNDIPTGGGFRYGLGTIYTQVAGYDAFGHGGEIIYSAEGYYFPEWDISIALMENDSRTSSVHIYPLLVQMLIAFEYYETIVAVEEVPSIFAPVIFPNPSEGSSRLQFELSEASEAQLSIFNNLGQRILTQSFRANPGYNQIQLPALPYPGLYRCVLDVGTNRWSHPWMKLK